VVADVSVKVKLNSAGVRALLRSPGVRADLAQRAERVLSAARASAPVKTGAYRDGLTSYPSTTDRAVHRVGSTARHAPVVEARTGNLARALDAAGR